MKREDYIRWFDELEKQYGNIAWEQVEESYVGYSDGPDGNHTMLRRKVERLNQVQFRTWVVLVSSAIASSFRAEDPVRVQWEAAARSISKIRRADIVLAFSPPFQAACQLVRDDRLGTLMDTVRAETLDDLLDQAEALRGHGYAASAVVLAGGALETHLRRLCERNKLPIKGDGTITSYNQAIDEARNAGVEVYGKSDSKQVTAWGGLRNDAAHRPAEFTRSKEEVSRMIHGIRDFLRRVP